MLTVESIERKIRSRVLMIGVLIQKHDWAEVKELATELLSLETELYRQKARADRELAKGKHGCDD